MTQWIISSSILTLIVIGLRFLLHKRIKPVLQYALWGLVLARLLLPFQLGSTGISLQNAIEKAPVVQQMELADEVVHFVYHADGTATGYYTYQPAWDHAEPEAPASKPVPQVFTQQESQTITQLRSVKEILMAIWLTGMAGMAFIFLLSNLRLIRKLKDKESLQEQSLLPVYVTEQVETPCLFGLFHPAIYLPPAVTNEPHQRAYAITHELTHYRHGDALWSVLRCLCLVVHWYNPLVWWAAILSRQDGEIACDEAAIRSLGEDHRAEYGRVLIDLTCEKKTALLQASTTMTGSTKDLKQRISMIVKRPKMALCTLIALVLIAAVAVGCTFTGGSRQDAPNDDTSMDSTEDTGNDQANQNNQNNQNAGDQTETERLPDYITGTALAETELEAFTQMFLANPADKINWYNQLLCVGLFHGFSSPQSVDPAYLFYNGFTRQGQEFGLNAQDQAFLDAQDGYVPQMDAFKLPVAEMDKVTQDYLGIPLNATNPSTLARLYYNKENACYYSQHTDYQSISDFQMIDGKRAEDGTVYLLCRKQTKSYTRYKTEYLLLLRLTPNSGNEAIPYRVYSCMQLPVETKNLITPTASAEEYGKVKAGYFPFIYTGRPLMTATYRIDPAGLEEGKLYVCDASTGRIYLVVNEKVSCFDATSEHLYYVTANSNQVVRCGYDYNPGSQKTIVYTATGTINSIDHYGTYANDRLLLVEDKSKVVLHRLSTGEQQELFTRHLVFDAQYDVDAKRYDKERSGHVILWRGLPKEDSQSDNWLYFVSSGEEAWLDRPEDPTAGYQGHVSRFSTGIFDGIQLNFYTPVPEDASGFRKGLLYSYDMLTGIYYQLSDSPVNRYCSTLIQDYLFFSDGSQIFRCNFMGGEMQVVYTSDHQITWVDYNGGNELLVTEDRKKAILYQLDTGKAEMVMEQYDIADAFYYPDSSELDGRKKGRAIFWHGKTPSDTQTDQYVYYIDLNELYNPPWL